MISHVDQTLKRINNNLDAARLIGLMNLSVSRPHRNLQSLKLVTIKSSEKHWKGNWMYKIQMIFFPKSLGEYDINNKLKKNRFKLFF